MLISIVSGFSIFLAAIFSLWHWNQRKGIFMPFFILVWLALVVESICYSLMFYGYTTSVTTNLYVLAESLLILWQFKRWQLFKNNLLFPAIFGLLVLAWLVESFLFNKIHSVSAIFRIIYSFLVVLMSIQMINQLILSETKLLVKNPIFLICIGFVIFFTYKILVETFWLYGLNSSREFRAQVYHILVYINLFVNLIYAAAVLWIPKRQEFILRS